MTAPTRRDLIDVEGVRFERVGVINWARPAYASPTGDAPVWECGHCGVLVARPPLHAAAHVRASSRDRAAEQARR